MASSYTDLLRLELMVQGEQNNTWGDITSDNLDKLEEAVAGLTALTMASSDITLTTNDGGDGTSEQAASAILDCAGPISANIDIIAPNLSKLYIINNGTTQTVAETVSIKTTAGSALEIPNGEAHLVWCDGDDGFFMISALPSGTIALATNALQLGGSVAALYALLAAKQSWTKPQTVLGQDITLTANAYTPNADTDSVMYLAQSEVTAAFTIENPTGTPVSGQIMVFHLEQHDTTPRSVTWGSEYIFTNDVNVDLTQTVDKVDTFTFQYNANLARWVAAGVAQNFPRS